MSRLFPHDALNPGVQAREVWAWAFYDFANSGFTTVVLTAVFNAYFVGVVAQGQPWGTLAWTLALAASSAVVMVGMPVLGAHADAHGRKKQCLAWATVGCIGGTVALAWAGPGDVAWAVGWVIVANVCFSIGESLIAAFLPELARPEAMGRVSGWGWSWGYGGGMLALGLGLGYVLWAQGQGLAATEFVPVTLFITAAVFALACSVTFWGLKERASPLASGATLSAWQRLWQTAREARQHRSFMWLMACATAYQAGIAVVVALAAVYAEQAMGFSTTDTMALIFLVNIAAAVGAFGFGYGQDRLGHKRALALTLVGWVIMVLMAVAATATWLFWLAAMVAGLCMGSSQSAGRAMAAVLAPPHRSGEFFGLWALATRAAAIVGPVVYGAVTWVTQGDHRLAILSTGVFFVLGLLLLRPVQMPGAAPRR